MPPGFAAVVFSRTSSVTSVLQELGWKDLQLRRDQNKATMVYRIDDNLVEIPVGQGDVINDSCEVLLQ